MLLRTNQTIAMNAIAYTWWQSRSLQKITAGSRQDHGRITAGSRQDHGRITAG